MSEKKTSIPVPTAYVPLLEDIRLLKSDENNPNKMTIKQQEQLWNSLKKYGWTFPIVTNKDGVVADGEQKIQVCTSHGEFFAPILRLPVSDIDRRLLRQVLNKLKGKHSKDLDVSEYMRIIQGGEKDNLQALLASVGEKLPEELGGKRQSVSSIPGGYEIIIECKDEADQKAKFDKLSAEGYKLRILTL
jgi:hypothetical protein